MANLVMLRDQRSFGDLLQESDTPMLLLDSAAVIRDINQPATQLLGGKREDYVGKEFITLVDPVDRFFLQERWKSGNGDTQGTRQYTVRLRRPEGRSDWHTLRVEAENESAERPLQLVHLQHLFTARGGF